MEKKCKKSTQIAIGGVFSALCLLTMFLSSAVPFSTFVMPALAGVMLMVVVVENGSKVAFMVYATVSLLSLFMVPDYEVKMLFILFFGYYPIVKLKIEKIGNMVMEYIVKVLIFSVAMVGTYFLLINIMGIPELGEEMGEFGKYSQIIFLAMGIFTFLIYDYSMKKYILYYQYRIRKLIVRQ